MMPAKSSKCFVPGCTSGYKSCTTKCSLFKPPKSPSKLAAWSRAIPRADKPLTENCKVCENHFDSRFIERAYTTVVDGQVISTDRCRPRLTDDAIPTIFPNLPKYLTKTVSQRRVKRTSSASLESVLQYGRQEKRQRQQEIEIDQVFSDHLDYESLTHQHASLCLKDWISSAGFDCICFGKVSVVNGQLSVVRSVTVFSDMRVQIYCNGKSSSLPNCDMVTTIQQFHQVLDLVDAAKDCPGSSEQKLTDNIKSSRKGVFENGKWRHVNCSVLTVNGERCLGCRRFRKLLQTSAAQFPKNYSRKLVKTVRRCSINNLRQRICTYRLLLSQIRKRFLSASASNVSNAISSLPGNQQLMVKHCVKQLKAKSPKGVRYDNSWILSCILLRIKSPKAYEHLRDHRFLPLPSRATLGRYIDAVRADTGISEDILCQLQQRSTSDEDRHGVLIFDEIKLRDGIKFRIKDLQFEGMVDLGEFSSSTDKSQQSADSGLVFMYRPLKRNWVQTVAMFLSHGPVSSAILSKMLLKLIFALESHGFMVDGIICDGSTTNRGVWKEFGISGRSDNVNNSIHHPVVATSDGSREQDRLYFFSDYVHLFKCIRNNLLNKKEFLLPDGSVKLSHFVELLRIDSCNGGLRAAPKLSLTHVNPNNLQRMNVRLAVQLFSNSVADALTFYRQQGIGLLQDVTVTVSFVRRMNRLFDILNARLPVEGLRLNSDKLMFLRDCLEWLDKWEVHTTALGCTKFLSASTSVGLRVTLMSTIQLSQDLLKCGYQYILTSKFSQDPLERFFGLIRYAAGSDDHPSTTMFRHLYRLLSVYSLLRLPKRCSSVESSGIAMQLKANSRTFTKRAQAVSTAAECLDAMAAFSNDDNDSDTEPSEQLSNCTTKDNIVYYVAGFVVRHCRRVTNCCKCLSAISSSPSNDTCASLINIKLRGALCWPSNTLYEALRKLEAIVSSYLQQDLDPFLINQIIEDGLPAFLPVRMLLCADHAGWLAAEIAVYYAVTRLHWHAKALNKASQSRAATRNKRKAAKLC